MMAWSKGISNFFKNLGNIQNYWNFEDRDSKTRIELRQPFLAVMFLVVLTWYIVFPSDVAIMGTVGLGALIGFCFFWSRSMATRVTCARRLLYTAFQVGDELEEQVFLDNDSHLPVLWAEFTDHSSIPDYTVTSVQAAGTKSLQEWRVQTTCKRRGVYRLGPWRVVIGDPFGIFQVVKEYKDQKEIVVYPPFTPLPPGLLPVSKAVGSRRSLNQPVAAETIDATSIRSYQPGDSIRHIHWKTTARRQQPFVKIFEPEAATTAWLVPDFDAACQVGSGSDSSVEAMVILVASIASELLQNHFSVGLLLNAALPEKPDAPPVTILPRYGRAHIWTALRALAPVEAVVNRPFEETLRYAQNLISGQDMLIPITSSLDLSWGDCLQKIIRNSSSSHRKLSSVRVVLLDPTSFEGNQNSVQSRTDQLEILTESFVAKGIPLSIIRKGEIKPMSGTFGKIRRWEFKTLGTGKVVLQQAPRSVEVSSTTKGI
jgi:uncharacterized protein (DUF58 family)